MRERCPCARASLAAMQRRSARALAIGVACGALWLVRVEPARAIEPPSEPETAVEGPRTTTNEQTDVQDPHDPTRAMHPVRVAAYVLHPVGVLLDYTIVRPAVWVARQEPFRTIFGYGDD
jgi:hypothetical protein